MLQPVPALRLSYRIDNLKALGFIALAFALWSSCRAQSTLPVGSIESCFTGGRPEYHKAFLSKVTFPDSLRTKQNSGLVFFEIQLDTSGHITAVQIIKPLNDLLDNEVRSKLYATEGMWQPLVVDGKARPYVIRDKVYFELR